MAGPLSALAAVAYRAARWPIQTIAIVSLLVFCAYAAFVDLAPHSPLGPLSRTFEVVSSTQAVPLTYQPPDDDPRPRFVGAKVIFDSGSSNSKVLAHISQVLGVVDNVALLSEENWYAAITNLREFTVAGTTWSLQSSFSWVVWARWYVARLSDLVSETPWYDLAIVGAGWIGMYATFWQLFWQLRALGSRTHLFSAALMSSTFAFLAAYALTEKAGLYVSKRALVQGLPFFVLVVGFDTKVALAREATRLSSKNEPADAVAKALRTHGATILRDNLAEVAFLLLVAITTRISGLWEFSVLSTLILVMDTLFLVTFFGANLSLKLTILRIERNHELRTALEDDGMGRAAARAAAEDIAPAPAVTVRYGGINAGAVRLALLFVVLTFNYLQLSAFPVSLMVNFSDLSTGPALNSYVSRLSYPSILTVLPPLRFTPTPASASTPAMKLAVVALTLSLVLNGYLFSLTRKTASSSAVSVRQVVVSAPPPPSVTPSESDSDAAALELKAPTTRRTSDDCAAVLKAGLAASLTDSELIDLGVSGKLPLYALEKTLKDTTRAVVIRRAIVSRQSTTRTLEDSLLPWRNYDYDRVLGACCENVIGYLPLPLGVAGPVIIDGAEYFLPMATTEGVLVASTMRGCKALNGGGGVSTEILGDGMTRGPCVTFPTASRSAIAKRWLDSPEGQRAMATAFNSTSRFARLTTMTTAQAGAFLYIRFRAQTGDAMGMNMISKGVERALQAMAEDHDFADMTIVTVSGNYCTDKKAAAINWIEGRGKSVVAEATVPAHLVRSILKTGVDELVELNIAKNLVGSAMAGAMGGFNAHAANLVAAVFLATGQDPAQVVEGSNCMTLMSNVGGDLQISVTMPSLEVGTIGGGTILEPQAAMLEMLGVKGPHASEPGANARQLARIVATAVLAAELSLNSALAAGHLVRSHMAHNRSKAPSAVASSVNVRS